MLINLEDLTINATVKPIREWNLNNYDWEDYRVEGFLDGVSVGHITVSRGLNCAGRYSDKFFLDISKNPPIPKPFVSYQGTEEQFRGNGVCGRLIIYANEFYRGKLETTLWSDTHFVFSFKEQSKKVWRKLQEQGLAAYKPHVLESGEPQDRWLVL